MASQVGFGLIMIFAAAFGIYFGIRYWVDKDYFARTQLRREKIDAERRGVAFNEAAVRARIARYEADGWRHYMIFDSLMTGLLLIPACGLLISVSFKADEHLLPSISFVLGTLLLIAVGVLNIWNGKLTRATTLLLVVGLALVTTSFVV